MLHFNISTNLTKRSTSTRRYMTSKIVDSQNSTPLNDIVKRLNFSLQKAPRIALTLYAMKKVPVTTIMICISWYSITSFAKVEVSIPQSDIITCERIRYVELSKSKSSDQTEESKQLDLVIFNEDS